MTFSGSKVPSRICAATPTQESVRSFIAPGPKLALDGPGHSL